MKRNLILTLITVFSLIPAWADDLVPEPLEQAIREYQAFEKSGGQVDPMNHETWKLYIQALLFPKGIGSGGPIGFLCTLDPVRQPQRHYFVLVKINNLYNFFNKVPQVGDVIAMEGRVTEYFKNLHLDVGYRVLSDRVVVFYSENAQLLPREPDSEATPVGKTTPVPVTATLPSAGVPTVSVSPVSTNSTNPPEMEH